MHLTSSPIDWYAARAGGVVAYVLLTVVVLLGIAMSSGARMERWPRFALKDVHRFAGLLTGTFLVIHIVDDRDRLVPAVLADVARRAVHEHLPPGLHRARDHRRGAAARARGDEPAARPAVVRRWRRLHYLNFAVWGAATVHGLGSGTDRGTPWLVAIEATAIGAVLTATGWRVLRARDALTPGRFAAVAGGAAIVAAAAVALVLGPLAFKPRPWNPARFTDALDGRILQQNGATRGIVSMAGEGTGSQHVLVRADLLIAPARLLDTAFQMEYLPSGAHCRGRVLRITDGGLGFLAHCRIGAGPRAHRPGALGLVGRRRPLGRHDHLGRLNRALPAACLGLHSVA